MNHTDRRIIHAAIDLQRTHRIRANTWAIRDAHASAHDALCQLLADLEKSKTSPSNRTGRKST